MSAESNAPAGAAAGASAEPTVLVREGAQGPQRLVRLFSSEPEPRWGFPVTWTPRTARGREGERECVLERDPVFSAGGGVAVWVPTGTEGAEGEVRLRTGDGEQRVPCLFPPTRPWQVHLVHFSHHDIGYTDVPPACLALHLDYLDRIIGYCHETRHYPRESQFRWTCDTTWPLKVWFAQRPDARVHELLELVREGRVEITAQYVAFNSALPDLEELIRSLGFAFELKRRYGIPLTSAMTTDIPGYPWAYPQLLSDSGIRYLMTSVNALWAQNGKPRAKEPRLAKPFYWEGPAGGRVLVWNTGPGASYFTEGEDNGFFKGFDQVLAQLPRHLAKLDETGYPYEMTSLRVGMDNRPPDRGLCEIVRQWNERFVSPRLILATSGSFLQTLEKAHAESFASCSGDWTDWWMDGPGSSAFETAISRRIKPALLAAEAMAAIAGTEPGGKVPPPRELEDAYDQMMLYDEHTWGMWDNVLSPFSSTTRQHWLIKAGYIYEAERLTRALIARSSARLCSRVAAGPGPSILVFNPHSWRHTGRVQVTIPDQMLAPLGEGWAFVDRRTGAVAPHQAAERVQHLGWRVETTFVFIAVDLPPLGYRVYDVVAGRRQAGAQSSPLTGRVLENRFYRLEVDQEAGGIGSITDRGLGKELVSPSGGYGLNEYVYDEGEPPGHRRHRPSDVRIGEGELGPVYDRLRIFSRCQNTPSLVQEVRLFHALKCVQTVNTIRKTETLAKEGIYFAFPCAIPNGAFQLDVAGAIMRPGLDQIPGSCLDWHVVQQWLDISNGELGVTWSSPDVPVVSLRDINSGKWLDALPEAGSSFFAYAMNNYWDTNFKESQGGEFRFRFDLTSHPGPLEVVAASRFGRECCAPLPAFLIPAGQRVEGEGRSGGDRAETPFLSLDSDAVRLESLKRSRDGGELVVRLAEIAGAPRVVKLALPLIETVRAVKTNPMEEGDQALSVSGRTIEVPLRAREIVTVRVTYGPEKNR